MNCKQCGKELIPCKFKITSRKKSFCNKDCRNKWCSNEYKSSKVNYKYRFCLGVLCKGEKMFKSTSLSNRICKKCRLAI